MAKLAVCTKCDGCGKIAGFLHIEGGMCFKCEGGGCIEVKSLNGMEEFKGKKRFINDGGKASLDRFYGKRRAEAKAVHAAEGAAKQATLKCNDSQVKEIFAYIDGELAFSMDQKVELVLWVMNTLKKNLYTQEWFMAKIKDKKEEVE